METLARFLHLLYRAWESLLKEKGRRGFFSGAARRAARSSGVTDGVSLSALGRLRGAYGREKEKKYVFSGVGIEFQERQEAAEALSMFLYFSCGI